MCDAPIPDDVIPMTERVSPLTEGLDVASADEKCDLMARAESEIFGGPFGAGLRDKAFLDRLQAFAGGLAAESHVLLAGAGTSGRLCRLAAIVYAQDRPSKAGSVYSTIAGGPLSLWRAAPLSEDRRDVGLTDFISSQMGQTQSRGRVIGVTCGLSAAYIDGILAGARAAGLETAVVGFNDAKHRKVDLFLESSPPTSLLNPIIGPEPVAGSVRMKGGTATLIILFVLLDLLANKQLEDPLASIDVYAAALMVLEKHRAMVACIMESAGESILTGGRLLLLGTGLFGALCIYDAAECPPTFGAERRTCQGFAEYGWDTFRTSDWTPDTKTLPDEISFNYFSRQSLSDVRPNDTIVIVCEVTAIDRNRDFLDRIYHSSASVFTILTGQSVRPVSTDVADVSIDLRAEIDRHFCQFVAVRSLLNRISTGAFAIAGKLYGNRMIDVRITNRKLFRRAVSLVASLVPTNLVAATELVTRSIGVESSTRARSDEIPEDSTVEAAASRRYVVPRAILYGRLPDVPASTIDEWMEREPIIRRLIREHLSGEK